MFVTPAESESEICASELCPVLSELIKLSLINGVLQITLKMTIVKPLYKLGDKNGIENYRPITLISI